MDLMPCTRVSTSTTFSRNPFDSGSAWSNWSRIYVQYCVYSALTGAETQVRYRKRTPTPGSSTLVHFLGDPSHLGAHVTYEEEADCCDGHYHLSHPESHVPAVFFGNSAEGKPCHESPHWNTRKMDCCQCFYITLGRYYYVIHPMLVHKNTHTGPKF